MTPQRSSVRARMSAQVAATVIGRPRIEPELSITSVTTVSRNLVSLLLLEGERLHRIDHQARQARRCRDSLLPDRIPRSGSAAPSNGAACRLARRPTAPCRWASCLSRKALQALQLGFVAKLFRRDDLVEFLGEDLVVDLLVEVVERACRTAHLAGRLAESSSPSSVMSSSEISAPSISPSSICSCEASLSSAGA